jgi:3-hydroxyanthranilate 3,4-dioxygenase
MSKARRKPSPHGPARPARRWAAAAQRAHRSVAARPVRRMGGATQRKAPSRRTDSEATRAAAPARKRRLRAAHVRAVSGVPFGLMDWIRRSMAGSLGPVANKEVFRHSDFIFQIIKGPNRRNDFHLDPYDEIFYQLKGTVWVHLIGKNGKPRVAEVPEGGVLLVSAYTPHSPRRPPGSLGLVVERPRTAKELDGIAWYCEGCGHQLEERWLPCRDIEVQLREALAAFNADLARRTCSHCGAVLPDPTAHPPWQRHVAARRAPKRH